MADLVTCPECGSQMLGVGIMKHNDDGSHAWTPTTPAEWWTRESGTPHPRAAQPAPDDAAAPPTREQMALGYIDEAHRWIAKVPGDEGTVATAQVYATLAAAMASLAVLERGAS